MINTSFIFVAPFRGYLISERPCQLFLNQVGSPKRQMSNTALSLVVHFSCQNVYIAMFRYVCREALGSGGHRDPVSRAIQAVRCFK